MTCEISCADCCIDSWGEGRGSKFGNGGIADHFAQFAALGGQIKARAHFGTGR